jgi:hypothetical protein
MTISDDQRRLPLTSDRPTDSERGCCPSVTIAVP